MWYDLKKKVFCMLIYINNNDMALTD